MTGATRDLRTAQERLWALFERYGTNYAKLTREIHDYRENLGLVPTGDKSHFWRILKCEIEPQLETLEDMLTVLKASYRDYRIIMSGFGYAPRTPLPLEADIQWARSVSQSWMDEAPYPAYLVDCGHRLHSWNLDAPRLVGLTHEELLKQEFHKATVLDLAFNPKFHAALRIVNATTFLPQMVQVMQFELKPFSSEPWCTELIDRFRQELPGFSVIWDSPTPTLPQQQMTTRVMGPLILDVPKVGHLTFQLWANDFIEDPRFRVVRYLPLNSYTMRQCATWAEEREQSN